jgi:hypothetical protein
MAGVIRLEFEAQSHERFDGTNCLLNRGVCEDSPQIDIAGLLDGLFENSYGDVMPRLKDQGIGDEVEIMI